MRGVREHDRTVVIPPCADPERRQRLEQCDEEWLRWYRGDIFTYDFTPQQLAMIEALRNAILYGGDQALAASRGEGKTTLFENVLLKYTLAGTVDFSVLFGANATAAENSLQAMRDPIERNERLHADYPEVCVPVRALEDTPNRAHYQIVSGHRHDNGEVFEKASSRFRWCGKEIILPNVPGSPAAWGIIATRGLDGAIRGLKKKDRRPKVVGIDDPDTEETVSNPEQAKKLEKRIDRGIAGLGGQQRGVARIMLTTLQRRECVSAWYTDPKIKPTFKGRRFRFLVRRPDREDLWEQYVQLRKENLQAVDGDGNPTDPQARGAHAFYLKHRAEMDAGAEVANPNRFNGELLPDGTQLEVSALQRYFNEVARIGAEAVATEFDNDPPEETGPVESGITPHRIQRQLSGFARQIVPPGCIVLVQGIDCRKVALHWVVRAWMPGASALYTIDYGVHEVLGTKYGSDEGLDLALRRAILARIEATKATEYMTPDGELHSVALTLVDAGWQTDAVYAACAEAGLGVMPVMGFGKSSGCTRANFSEVQRSTPDRRPGDGYFLSRKGKLWLVCADADRWKRWEHERWMTAPGKPGCAYLFGNPGEPGGRLSSDERDHTSYAHHICNEAEIEEPYKGTIRRIFKAKSPNTHYLDASYYADVGAAIKGIRLAGMSQPKAAAATPPVGGWFAAQKKAKP